MDLYPQRFGDKFNVFVRRYGVSRGLLFKNAAVMNLSFIVPFRCYCCDREGNQVGHLAHGTERTEFPLTLWHLLLARVSFSWWIGEELCISSFG